MIVNLWSTPRTGSNWYSVYLYNYYKELYPRLQVYPQYLNHYHLYNYESRTSQDFVYQYDSSCSYKFYYFDHLRKRISSTYKFSVREIGIEEEEKYRLELLDRHDFKKVPSIFYSHVAPMSKRSYQKLFDIADRNIFLYRKNVKRQLSSYALAMGTQEFRADPTKPYKPHKDIDVNFDIIKNLADRIIYWHNLDKNGCEIICYDDLKFEEKYKFPIKQNIIDPFLQLSDTTQKHIVELDEYVKQNLGKNSLLY